MLCMHNKNVYIYTIRIDSSMKKEETVDFNIKAAWHAISRMYNQVGQDRGVTTSTGFVLLNINPEFGTRATKIAPLMGMEATSLSRILKSMEEQGFIYRQPDPEDGRAVRIFLTEKGRKDQEEARDAVLSFNEEIKKSVNKSDLETFFQVIQKINQVIEVRST